ncbi:MAG: NAD(P)H-dependent glycerol-3-phosphate dehydrogenase [bacterium]
MKLTVLGAGCWGSVLTRLLANNFDEITLWNKKEFTSEEFIKTKKLTRPMEVQLPDKVEIETDLQKAVEGADIILYVISTTAVREVSKQLKEFIKPNQILINASKGLELETFKRMSEVIHEELPDNKVAVLSGPTLAAEVLKGLPTAASIACECPETAFKLQDCFYVKDKFRLYSNPDIIGVELGGSLKNVIAIASGFIDAMELGNNTRGTMLTRGMAEIARISIALGANPSTLYGLSGMGDLIATASSPLSRNYRVGYMLGQGKKLDEILASLGSVAEGVKTSKAVCDLVKELGISAPLTEMIYEVLYTEITPKEAVSNLMNRSLKQEEQYYFGG